MRNYTQEILRQVAQGRVAVRSVGTAEPVTHSPRSKNDPEPWTNGSFRYSGREVHTLPSCGKRLLRLNSGSFGECAKHVGHDKAHRSN